MYTKIQKNEITYVLSRYYLNGTVNGTRTHKVLTIRT